MKPRRPGRPPIDRSGVPSADVHLTLPAHEYDFAYKIAQQRRESVQEVIRRGLKKLFHDERGGPIE